MASRIRRPLEPAYAVTCYGRRDYRSGERVDPRLEQDMDVMLEADVEYFDHPTLGRIRLRDQLVHPDTVCALEGDIEAEQLADEFP